MPKSSDERLISGPVRERIGQGLIEHYQGPQELPPKFLALIRKLDAKTQTLMGTLHAIEGNYLKRYTPPIEPSSISPRDDWAL